MSDSAPLRTEISPCCDQIPSPDSSEGCRTCRRNQKEKKFGFSPTSVRHHGADKLIATQEHTASVDPVQTASMKTRSTSVWTGTGFLPLLHSLEGRVRGIGDSLPVKVHLDGVINDQISWTDGVDLLWITTQLLHGVPHRCKVHHSRDSAAPVEGH